MSCGATQPIPAPLPSPPAATAEAVSTAAGQQAHQLVGAHLGPPAALSRRRLSAGLMIAAGLGLLVVLVVTLLPGLASLRARFTHARVGWLVAGAILKLLSGLAYVAIFRAVFSRRMSWRLAIQIGASELGANALLPTGGAGGLALGAWALRRVGLSAGQIARRTVAFFLLTSLANVLALIVVALGLALGLFAGRASPLLTLIPASVAGVSIVAALAAGWLAGGLQERSARRHGATSRRARTLGSVAAGVREAVARLRERDAWLVIGAAGYLGFDIMVLWATFHAVGSSPPLAIIWIAYLIGELGRLIPMPGGLGAVDIGLVGMLVLYHVPVGAATAAVLAYRGLALWIPATLGASAFLALRRTMSSRGG